MIFALLAALTLQQHYTPKDRDTGRYQYVPVDVPEGTTRLTIEYRYDRAEGKNVIDLGLFEPGPLDLGTKSYRGWSGGERNRITVGVADATPGYWPGPLPPGRWHVMLGLYKVAEPGVDVELVVETSREPAATPPSLAPRPKEPVRPGPAWFSGALHAHTVHSDGTLTAAELAKNARAEGLDFLAITDHNNTTHQLEPIDVPGLLLIVGEEVTTPAGHASVWGLGGARDYVDFRILGDKAIDGLVAATRARGALFSINHPTAECLGCAWTQRVPAGVMGIEISNPGHEGEAALALWDSLLREGRWVTAIGASDWHRGPRPLGSASVRVFAQELSARAILSSIRQGRVVVMADARTLPPRVVARSANAQAGIGDTLELLAGEDYRVDVDGISGRVDLFWNGEKTRSAPAPARLTGKAERSGYLRVHVYAADGSPLAVTNPIWLQVRKP